MGDLVGEPCQTWLQVIVKGQKGKDTASMTIGGQHILTDTEFLNRSRKNCRSCPSRFLNGNLYLTLFDTFGSLFGDPDFATLFPDNGQPALSPVRLILILIL
jgi:hypothetical protein